MKITINENSAIADTEITISCKEVSGDVLKIISILRSFDYKLTGMKSGQLYIIEAADVLYFDTADKHTFIYTEKDVFETPLKLYELEERLSAIDFFRSSKSAIINISQISSLCPEFGGRIEVTMSNREKMLVSRQYATVLKNKLGLR